MYRLTGYVVQNTDAVYLDNEVDGDTFMELSEADFKEMIPGKIGVVKKLIRVQRTVNSYILYLHVQCLIQKYCTWVNQVGHTPLFDTMF